MTESTEYAFPSMQNLLRKENEKTYLQKVIAKMICHLAAFRINFEKFDNGFCKISACFSAILAVGILTRKKTYPKTYLK